MQTVGTIRRIETAPGLKTLAGLAPLWLFSIAISAEGFPRPPVSGSVAIACFIAGVTAGLVLLWRRWLSPAQASYSLLPLLLAATYDEISTTYKTPYIILCALSLTIGAFLYRRIRSSTWSGLILLAFAALTWLLASHAAQNYWEMVAGLGIGECFPDASGCPSLTGAEPTWWVLFFSL